MNHLIADSGIHFITHEIEFNPSEPLLLDNGKTYFLIKDIQRQMYTIRLTM